MFCNKCGKELNPEAKFCQGCGNPVGEVNPPVESTAPVINNSTINTPVVDNNVVPSTSVVEVKPSNGYGIVNNNAIPPKKKSIVPIIIILVVFFLFIIGIVVAAIFIFKGVASTSNKLVCESKEGNITIMYNDTTITGYTVSGGITYDFDTQKKYADQKGGEAYVDEFNKWFENNTSGTCRKELLNSNEPLPTNNNEKKEDNNVVKSGYKRVGEDKFGYVDIPSNWNTFYDTSGTHSIQFSYATTYIVTIDYVEKPAATAKTVAETFYNNNKSNTNISNLDMKTVTVGKEKYTAYKVGMYYINENTYLYTYWFDIPGDSNMHYIAIEGPKDVEKYNDIIDSYRLTK